MPCGERSIGKMDNRVEPTGSRRSRSDTIAAMLDSPLDVLIVGGGILGAGIARDGAMRGLRVGLVEQYDMAFGSSSRSSRMLHGGLRYLSQGHLKLVREASIEKGVIHRIAPHLADPLPFVFPTYRGSGWPLWQVRFGVKLYDFLCGGRNLGPSRSMCRDEIVEYLPGVKTEGLTGGVRYFDGLTNDARLVIDTLRSAAQAGAILCNYARLCNASPQRNSWQCEVGDELSGQQLRISARAVVNATGPWAETLPHSSVKLRLTKGIHLVVDRRRLPVPDAVFMTIAERALFAIPWGERVILGSTDTDYEGPLDDVRADGDDVAYVLDVVNGAFPDSRLGSDDVIGSWAGLRPLIASGSTAAEKGKPSNVSRAHKITMPQPGWFDIAGGKLTTYRLIGQQTIDRLMHYLDRKGAKCGTAAEPLIRPEEAQGTSGIVPPPPSRQLIEHFCKAEWAVHLDDVMLRRAGWHYYRTDSDQVAGQVAAWMAEILGWSAADEEAELGRYRRS